MLHRTDSEGLLVISQPAHSWISGQIARVWGSGEFETPSEEVCLAAELHDIGFLRWEESPTLNPETGLPHDFLNMPPELHLEIWNAGIRHMLRFGRYSALLVSLHFSNIARQNWVSRKKDGVIKQYMDEQETFQQTVLTSLRNDFHYGAYLTDEAVLRDQQLVSVLDWISLLVCLGLREPKTITEVPSRSGRITMEAKPLDSEARTVKLSPWPLRVPSLKVVCEGRRLLKTYKNEEEMREAHQAASRVTLLAELRA